MAAELGSAASRGPPTTDDGACDGDGLDFDYLMALIYNAVGPCDKDAGRPAPSLGRLDDDDGDSSCEEGELETLSTTTHASRDDWHHSELMHDPDGSWLNRDVSHYLVPSRHQELLHTSRPFERNESEQVVSISHDGEALAPSPPSMALHRYSSGTSTPPRQRFYPNYERNTLRADKSRHFRELETMLCEYDESEPLDASYFSSDDEGTNNDDDHDSQVADDDLSPSGNATSEVDLEQNLLTHLPLLGFDPDIVSAVLLDVGEAPARTNEICATRNFVAIVQALGDDHANNNSTEHAAKPHEPRSPSSSTAAAATSFPWPVFDMAQYEFGTARPGTCFASVVVLVNLPAVSDATAEALHHCLLTQLFANLSTPLQVVLPQVPSTGLLKGHGFLEFSDRHQATLVARALDGLLWSAVFPPFRAMLFREYDGSHRLDGAKNDRLSGLRFHSLDLESEDDGDENQLDEPTNRLTRLEQQLAQRNDQLEYLLQCVERDRDAVLGENDELRHLLDAYRVREKQQEQALLSLSSLRKRIQLNEQKYREHMRRMRQNEHVTQALRRRLEELTGHPQSLHALEIPQLRELEDTLDTALYKVRTIKEQKIQEQKQLLDRQVEVQQELKLCVICLTAEKTILCLPCRHVCMCEACSGHAEVVRCPICRLPIDEKMLIYA
ncbi:hypothetical protein ACHHYP_07860 [Achlya hypogyna]|uniref:RING-type domain-containing protein n=1 Tax=Achlya hypogyna TaxID=1202772 RepID=A0A1V9ZLD0_ACHHY|nr:hypothetical protein ACHHYP_07860 [Achlya hypogyna]